MAEENYPEKRPGPFAQDRSRTPPNREQREKDYLPEKRNTGNAIEQKAEMPPDPATKGANGLSGM
jgi:hypothetical protein